MKSVLVKYPGDSSYSRFLNLEARYKDRAAYGIVLGFEGDFDGCLAVADVNLRSVANFFAIKLDQVPVVSDRKIAFARSVERAIPAEFDLPEF
jgi:hypothetical protein